MTADVNRVEWVPGTDDLHARCHCGAQRTGTDPVAVWEWLLAHPDGHDASGPSGRPVPQRPIEPVVIAAPRKPLQATTATTAAPASVTASVVRRTEIADGVAEFVLLPERPLAWTPGAHVDLLLPDGLERQYSLCGDPAAPTLTIAVLREPDGRGGSAWVHDALRVGDQVGVRGPRNHFALAEAPGYLFLAGGIGITPLLPMLRLVAASTAPWRFCFGGRSRSSMAYADEVTALGGELFCGTDLPLDELLADAAGAVYCCGPAGLIDAVRARRPDAHVERFVPLALDTSADVGFEVECSLSGRTVPVGPRESILDAVRAAGLDVLSSCEEGTCGTCETGVVAGEVEHRDSLLSDAERQANEVMMICCSRARGERLVLEL